MQAILTLAKLPPLFGTRWAYDVTTCLCSHAHSARMLPNPKVLKLAFEQQKKAKQRNSHSATPEFIFRGIALGFSNGVVYRSCCCGYRDIARRARVVHCTGRLRRSAAVVGPVVAL